MENKNSDKNIFNPKMPARRPIERLKIDQSEAKVQASITIHKVRPEKVYEFWRKLSNLPLFMKDLESIEELTKETSKWTVKLKSGVQATWTAKIIADQPGHSIAWKSIEGDIETEGAVSFTEAGDRLGTVVTLAMDYKIPGGKLAEIATALMGEKPEMLIAINLKRLRGFLETGEIATIDGQTSGRSEDKLSNGKNLH